MVLDVSVLGRLNLLLLGSRAEVSRQADVVEEGGDVITIGK